MPSSNNKNRNKSNYKVSQGRHYEQMAALFYEQKGFEILDRNWRAAHKEIDLIVKKDQLLIFVEVKSSRSEKFGHPVERVNQDKIKNLSDAARQYLLENKIEKCDLQFDVVTFVKGRLEHYPNAFETK